MPLDQSDYDPVEAYQMPVGEHLEELRRHILKALLYVALGTIVCLIFQDPIVQVVTAPHREVMQGLSQERWQQRLDSETGSWEVDEAELAALLETRAELEEGGRRVRVELTALDPPDHAQLQELRAEGERLADRQRELLARTGSATAADLEALASEAQQLEEERQAFEEQVARLIALLPEESRRPPEHSERLQFLSYTEVFMSYLKLSLVCALLLTFPLVAWELWKFVAAGLYPDERRYVRYFAPFSLVAFAGGAWFGYSLLIPLGLQYLASYGDPELVTGGITLADYISTFLMLTFFVGLSFELPLVMLFLGLIRVVTMEQLSRGRRYFILGAVVVAAIVTPPDAVTQVLLAIPLVLLYEVGLLLIRVFVKPPASRESEEEQGSE